MVLKAAAAKMSGAQRRREIRGSDGWIRDKNSAPRPCAFFLAQGWDALKLDPLASE
jgi:hypothetical protein